MGEPVDQQAFYRFAEGRLQAQFPANQHVRPKIRQQLQTLVARGILTRTGPGHYRVIA